MKPAINSVSLVKLVDGEMVLLAIKYAQYQNQVFVRLSPTVILGIVNTQTGENIRYDNVYLWQKAGKRKDSPYTYLGDITFKTGKELGNCVAVGLSLSKALSRKMKVEAFKHQRQLTEDLVAGTDTGNIINCIPVGYGFLCSALLKG